MTFFLLDKSQDLGKAVCGKELTHDDTELWEGIPFPKMVPDRLSLYEEGKAVWKDRGCRCLSHKKRQGHVLA